MASRAIMILASSVLWILTLAGCQEAGSAESHAPAPRAISFAEFRSCQEDYCWKVAEFLNTPIDWHLVLDVSGSYLEARDPITENLLLLIRSLPLQDGDSLTIDAFSQVYYQGDRNQDVTSEWIQRIKGERGELVIQSDVEHLFTRLDNKPPFPNEITDIAGLFTGPRAGLFSHALHHPNDARLFYIVLTDGSHDPTGRGASIPLFRSAQQSAPQFKDAHGRIITFLEALEAFVDSPPTTRFRALFLIIDPKPIDWRRGPDPVRKDWDAGLRQIASLKSTGKARFLHAAFWNKGGDLFTGAIKRPIGRLGGVYPCLVTGTPWQPSHPTVTGLPYPLSLPSTCSSAAGIPTLEIPPDLANGQKESAELPLLLLASETKKRDLLITFKANKANAYSRSHVESFEASRDDAYSGWKPVLHPIKVPSFENDPEFQFPWIVEVGFNSQREQPPFLNANLTEPSLASSVFAGMSQRGKALIFWAFLAWAFSLLCAWLYTETASLVVRVQVAHGNLKPAERFGKLGRKQRVRHLKDRASGLKGPKPEPERLEIRDVDREDLPDLKQVKGDHIVFDVIPIFNVVYHLIYMSPGRQLLSPGRQRDPSRFEDALESITFTGRPEKSGKDEVFTGAFLRATTFWKPSEDETRRAWWLRLLGPWHKCNHTWKEHIFIPDSASSRQLYLTTTTIEENWWAFTYRAASVILSSIAFGLSLAAIAQSFSRSHHPDFIVRVVGWAFFAALLVYTFRYWPQFKRDRKWWLWADSCCTFLLHAFLLMGLFASVFAKNSVNRLTVLVIIFVGLLFAVPTYEKLRDRLVSSRLKQQQPVNKWDFFLEIFLARLCSW